MNSPLKRHLAALRKEIPGARISDDIGYLHRLRVASRRLRNTLWVFKELFPERKYKRLRNDIRALTEALGDARDLDTQISFYRRLLPKAHHADIASSLSAAIDRLLKRRRCQQKRVKEAIDEFERTGISARIDDALAKAPGTLLPAGKKIKRRLKAMLRRQHTPVSPEEIEELHTLRIAAKRLRYTLEEFKELKQKEILLALQEATVLQDALGDMHNYYIWTHAPVKDRPTARYIRRVCREHYAAAYRRFIYAWKKQERNGTWKELTRFLNR